MEKEVTNKLPVNNPVNEIIAGMKMIGLLDLPEAKEGDEKFIAYGMYVDSKPFLCHKLTKKQYEFSYFLTAKEAWIPYLPENWKSWSLWDIVRNIPVCGSTRP